MNHNVSLVNLVLAPLRRPRDNTGAGGASLPPCDTKQTNPTPSEAGVRHNHILLRLIFIFAFLIFLPITFFFLVRSGHFFDRREPWPGRARIPTLEHHSMTKAQMKRNNPNSVLSIDIYVEESPEFSAYIIGPSLCAVSVSYMPKEGKVHMSAHTRVNGTYVLNILEEFRSMDGEGELCLPSARCLPSEAGLCLPSSCPVNRTDMSSILARVVLNYTGREVLQYTFDVDLSKQTKITNPKCQLDQAANSGCWRLNTDFPDLTGPANHAGQKWLWQPDYLDVPIFMTASQMRAILNGTGDILFIGDSSIRTTYQAFIDVAIDFQYPWHAIGNNWCGFNGTQHFPGLGDLLINGEGCWTGNVTFTLILEEKNVTLSYLPIFLSKHTTLDVLVDAGEPISD